jgi:hypothetical protein
VKLHRPTWIPLERIGDVIMYQCSRIRIHIAGGRVPDRHTVARAGIVAALVQAWPELETDQDEVGKLAAIALDAVLRTIPLASGEHPTLRPGDETSFHPST